MYFLKEDINQAIITLGGKGTRIKSITNSIPKPLYLINGISTLERSITVLQNQGISKFIFFINYKSDLFKEEAALLMKKYNIIIKLFEEEEPRGEAGSIYECIKELEDNFLFINGDIIFEIDLIRLFNFHNQKQADITIITHFTNHPEDSDCIIESPSLSISKYKLKNIPDKNKSFHLGNAGISVLKKKVIIKLKKELDSSYKEISLFRDIVVKALNNNFKVFSYNTSEYLKDMGTPDRLRTVENDIRKNFVTQKSYKTKQKVLFLDRDNTIIECPEKKYITKKEQIIIFKNRVREIAKISKDFDFALIITNQPQISMGLTSWQNVIEINGIIINQCFLLGLEISGVYLCPHHPHADFKGEVKFYKVNCFCRKPLPGLFYEASYWRNIDLKSSLLIGDSTRDYYAAKNVGMKFIHTNNL